MKSPFFVVLSYSFGNDDYEEELADAFDELSSVERTACNYFGNIILYLDHEEYDVDLLESIEAHAGIPEQAADDFRRSTVHLVFKYLTEKEDLEWDFIPQLASSFKFQANLEEDFEDSVEQI